MKKVIITSLIITMVLSLGVAFAEKPEGNGNGAPSGPHFTLNLIGVQKAKKVDFDEHCGNGHRIFVPLNDSDKRNSIQIPRVDIKLTSCELELGLPEEERCDMSPSSVWVKDCDATDGSAELVLPNPAPDPAAPMCTRYSVYIRALGKPGKIARMKTCATLDGIEQCAQNDDIVVLEHKSRIAPKFSNVSRQLLTLCVCFEYDETTGECLDWERVYLFDSRLENYLWAYESDGLKHAQIRFYMEPTCETDPAKWDCP